MSPISSVILPPLSVVYAAITRGRLAAYQRGLLPVTTLDVPVISVGNITTGGTGKTPLVEWISRALAREGRKVCILTRGYGRQNSKGRVVVSDGSTVLADAAEAGDEPCVLAENLQGIAAVISDADRVAAGRWAIEKLGTDVFVLDDGFQHLRLARDLDILTIDATNPWGGGHLLPYGRMREGRAGIARADCVVITRVEQTDDVSLLKNDIRLSSGDRPVFVSQMQSRGFREIPGGLPVNGDSLPAPVAAFCAVGNPGAFFEQVRRENLNIVLTREFPDHHRYDGADIKRFSQEAKQLGAVALVTTAKDAVKLYSANFDLPCFVLEIEIALEEDDRLLDLIRAAIRR